MKPVWKWVIGIVIVLVVVAAVVGGIFLLRGHLANVVHITRLNQPGVQVPGNGNGKRVPRQFPNTPPLGYYGWPGRGIYMRGPGMMGFGLMPFVGLVGCLFSLGVLTLIVLGIIWLVRSLRKPVVTAAPVASIAEPVEQGAQVEMDVHTCPKCGEPVQEGWKHCPNCGKHL